MTTVAEAERSITPESEPAVRIKRVLRAPRERVWRAWTEGNQLAHWFGPRGSERCTIEPTTGGSYRFVVKPVDDGRQPVVAGRFVEVVPNERLRFTWAWERNGERGHESMVEVTFKDHPQGTELLLQHGGFADEDSRDHHHKGWSASLDRIDSLLAE